MSSQTPPQPPWGRYIQERREAQGRTIRQICLGSGISDSYWGQVERGYQTQGDSARVITPSRSKLLEMAESLRLSDRQTNELLGLAGYRPIAQGVQRPAGRGEDVDLRGLSVRDVRLLNLLADRLRQEAPGEAAQPTPLRRVARGKAKTQDDEAARDARVEQAASENPARKRP